MKLSTTRDYTTREVDGLMVGHIKQKKIKESKRLKVRRNRV